MPSMAKEIQVSDDEDGGRLALSEVRNNLNASFEESINKIDAMAKVLEVSHDYEDCGRLTRSEVRDNFKNTYGESLETVDVRKIFQTEPNFLGQFIFFFGTTDEDIQILCEICKRVIDYENTEGDALGLIDGTDDCMLYQVKEFALMCLQTAHNKRADWSSQILLSPDNKDMPFVQLLKCVAFLVNCRNSWACELVGYLQKQKVYCIFREIILTALERTIDSNPRPESALEKLLIVAASHSGKKPCCCPLLIQSESFIPTILSINGIWNIFPGLLKVLSTDGLGICYINQMAAQVPGMKAYIPDVSPRIPGYACVLANLLEIHEPLGQANAADMICIYSSLLDDLPNRRSDIDGLPMDGIDSDMDEVLYRRIAAVFNSDSVLIQHLVNSAVEDVHLSDSPKLLQYKLDSMSQVACFIHILLQTFGNGSIYVLAHHTDIMIQILKVFVLFKKNNLATFSSTLSDPVTELILLLPIFSLLFKYILETTDHVEFYEHQKPFLFDELELVVVMLKEALWNLLCDSRMEVDIEGTSSRILGLKKLSLERLKSKAKQSICELLFELQSWNTRREFTEATNFCCEVIGKDFVSKAMQPDSLECQILKFAPFLIPFEIRAAILKSHITSSKSEETSVLNIRRDHLLDDWIKLGLLTDGQLKGKCKVAFFIGNANEDGVDMGGLFVEFLDDASKAAFNPETGMMKGTRYGQLYPSRNSGSINPNHLKVFRFLGTLLGKAVFDGIPLNLPLAPFFIRKIMQKPVFISDLISLDVDTYTSLLNLKSAENLSDLDLAFCTENEGSSEQYLYEGETTTVSHLNINSYLHLHANHLLINQIEEQSIHFTKGLHRLIRKEWIEMFNENEFQTIISGIQVDSGLDIDDLCNNTIYHDYDASHHTIQNFWKVLRGFDSAGQRKFLKFVTSQSCVPYNGFQGLKPEFNIRRYVIDDHESIERLPTVSTCFNTLRLPPYDSEEMLKTKLWEAMHCSSFGLA